MNPAGPDQFYEILVTILGFGAVLALLLGIAMLVSWVGLRGGIGKIKFKSRRRPDR